jgi:uncharacterized cupredoxin-like copper-binding protein
MTISTIIGILIILCSLMSFAYRTTIPSMTGMMAAMGIGMSSGLTMGVLLGVTLQGNLLISTILSMAIGMIAGLLVGLPICTLSVLDGISAGVMGGMMGAMLGEMIPLEDAIVLIKILLNFSFFITFIILILFLKNKEKDERINKRWLLRPILTFFILLLLFIGIDQINFSSDMKHLEQLSHQNDHIDQENRTSINSASVSIVTSGLNYYPNQITIEKLEAIEFRLINNDNMGHDLEIRNIPHYNHTVEINNSHMLHVNAKPRSVSVLSFTPLKEGTYEYYCTIPGHKEGGMFGILVVN